MNITLKNVKFSEHLSEETNAFTATLHVDGKKIGECRNDGRGGNTYVDHLDSSTKQQFRECEEYCKSLPPIEHEFNGEQFSVNSNLEHIVDDLFEQWLRKKEEKKLERKMKNHLMWGVPKGYSYRTLNFGQPISSLPKEVVQKYIDKYKVQFKEGEKFLNTNLDGFDL